ncbi:DUF4262 domain-containing protein [Alteromonas alba]|uniref:DUF4262 domain-containing protein n=1 Tax=Alteromonas alba TaxID=2079529 RepID=A0A2S9V4W6_9ALTE|nr:DUF4262 domain-containing protein [Alteromonas alba]PRO71507.1 DUF4262 domain-containing protein [Alteromonas alba]
MSKEEIKKNIKEYGWHFLFVFDPNGEHEDFSYSIGLEESFDHPEIVIFGLKKESAHAIISDIVEDIKSGIKMESDKKLGNVIGGNFEVIFKPIKIRAYKEYLGTAVDYYDKPFRAQIMFWPDKSNILPTEDGCEVTIQNEALTIV